MPTGAYGRWAHVVDRMISTYGYSEDSDLGHVFLRRNGIDRECRGVELNFSPRDIDGVLIHRDDRRFVLSTKTSNGPLMPPPDDESDTLVIINGPDSDDSTETELIIVTRPKRLAPAGVVLFWELQCRSK